MITSVSSKICLTKSLFILPFLLLFSEREALFAQNLHINEIMSSNSSVNSDEDGDFEDWIEIYNSGDGSVQMNGYGLSDDIDRPFRWVFPDTVIAPGEFMIVWASGKDRANPGSELHTNYGISSEGEEILLTHPNGTRVDLADPIIIPVNTSFGRQPDGTGDWYFFNEPTPGALNETDGYKEQLAPPTFSHEAGFYTHPIDLELSHPGPGVEIYYTLDGSEPTRDSFPYNGAITLSDRSNEVNTISMIPTNKTQGSERWMEPLGNVRKANILRVRALSDSGISQIQNKTYFIFDEETDKYNLPVISLVTDKANLFDEETGIYVPGVHYSYGNHGTGNYYQRGIEWERPSSLELFEKDGTLGLQQDMGIRIHGGFTRRYALKSLRLYARASYGENRFNYRIFDDPDYDSYNRLILRNSGNDFGETMFMDAAAQSLIRHFNVDTQAYKPVIVFINGEYWGIQNLRERYDKHYLERVYAADPNNIDLLTDRNSVEEGDHLHYNEMISFIEENDVSVSGNFDDVQTRMDVDNFLDYYSAQIYYGNTDWPQGNIDFWRSKKEFDPNAPTGLDGRWRWLLYDVDRSLGYMTDASFDMVDWVTRRINTRSGEEWPNFLLRNLLENESFHRDFINRIAGHLNTAFTAERVSHVIDSLKSPLESVIDEHIDRWQNHGSRNNWENKVQEMYRYAEERPDYLRQHLMDHFDIGEETQVLIDVSSESGGYVRINTTDINSMTPGVNRNPYPWTGLYFSKVPVTLSAHSRDGYVFSHWTSEGDFTESIDLQNPEITYFPESGVTFTAHFIKDEDRGHKELIHYWVFTNDLPNNAALERVDPVYSVMDGARLEYKAAISPYPPVDDETAGILDRVNDPTEINYISSAFDNVTFEESGMRGIRARNPSLVDDRESSLLFHLPTTGFADPEFTFAAVRTGNGQRRLNIEFSTDSTQTNWSSEGLDRSEFTMYEAYKEISVRFDDIPEAENNASFRVRILFGGDEDIRRGESGNVRFNNVSLKGLPDKYVTAEPAADLPARITLDQNYPNPFNPVTVIRYALPETEYIQLTVYDMIGRKVATLVDEQKTAGVFHATFDASGLSSGIYLYKLNVGDHQEIRKMTLIK